MSYFRVVVGFSATVKPFEYYARLSGFDPERLVTAEFLSPFPPERRKLLVIPQVTTKFRYREQNYEKIASVINRVVARKRGNYFAFFPSFEFLRRCSPFISVPGFRVLKQEAYMSSDDAQAIIESLKEQSRGVIVLGVQGGIFSEGVDYPGDLLIGAFIIGPGLPAFEFERELLRKYYEGRFGDGFAYAYVYPGMTRVVQAAGRVIRTEQDRGLIVLMDDRFVQDPYTSLMPSDWLESGVDALVSKQILTDVDRFWESGAGDVD
jgi:DNA excision repair protein ERCC-2